MHLLLVAPPGAGKGTQSEQLVARLGVEHIASGELFRWEVAQGTDLGSLARSFLDRGDLVPDEVVMAMMHRRVLAASREGGYILDGFPRNLAQARAAQGWADDLGSPTIDAVVYLSVPREELERRLLARAHRDGRSDDSWETITHRLEIFEQETRPLLEYYEGLGLLLKVDGFQAVDRVTEDVMAALSSQVAGS